MVYTFFCWHFFAQVGGQTGIAAATTHRVLHMQQVRARTPPSWTTTPFSRVDDPGQTPLPGFRATFLFPSAPMADLLEETPRAEGPRTSLDLHLLAGSFWVPLPAWMCDGEAWWHDARLQVES